MADLLNMDLDGVMQPSPGEGPGTAELRHRYRRAPPARTVSLASGLSHLSRATAPAAVQGPRRTPLGLLNRQRSAISSASVRSPDMLPMKVGSQESKKTMLSRQKSRQRDLGHVQKVTAYYSDMTQLGKKLFDEALSKTESPDNGSVGHLPSLGSSSGKGVSSTWQDTATQSAWSHDTRPPLYPTSSILRKTKVKPNPTLLDNNRTVAFSNTEEAPYYQSAIRKHIEDISHKYQIVVDKSQRRDDYANCLLLPVAGTDQQGPLQKSPVHMQSQFDQEGDTDLTTDVSKTNDRSSGAAALQQPRRSWVDDVSVTSPRLREEAPEEDTGDPGNEDKQTPEPEPTTKDAETSPETPAEPQIVHLADLSVDSIDGPKLPDYICPSSETKSREVAVKIWLGKTSFPKALRTVPLM